MSSEALERRESIHKLCVTWMSVPSLPDNAIPASPDDVLWLLAEVARLEQESDDWEAAANEAVEQADAARQLAHRLDALIVDGEAALAVAREREQRLRTLLAKFKYGIFPGYISEVRAALVDEPAAAEDCPCPPMFKNAGDPCYCQDPAAATLAEPGGNARATSSGAVGPRLDLASPVPEANEAARPGNRPGSASAAADEPPECPVCGNETPEADLTYSGCPSCRAAADEPGETP